MTKKRLILGLAYVVIGLAVVFVNLYLLVGTAPIFTGLKILAVMLGAFTAIAGIIYLGGKL